MIVAALGDLRGHWPALQAVLAEIDAEGIQSIVHTGNCAAGYPWPNEVVACLRERGIPGVQGEWDRLTVRFNRKQATLRAKLGKEPFEAIEAAYAACLSIHLEYLRTLPRNLTLTIDGVSFGLFHGTVSSQAEALHDEDPDERFMRQREMLPHPLMIFGHNIQPYARWVAETLFVTPGALVDPEEPGVARYSVISTESDPWRVHPRRVPFDA